MQKNQNMSKLSHTKDDTKPMSSAEAEVGDGGITPQQIEITKGKVDPSSME